MNKKSIIGELSNLRDELERIQSYIKSKDELKVSGSLRCSKRDGKYEYLCLSEEGKVQYLGKDDMKIREQLAKKKQYQKMFDAAEREKVQIEKCIKTLQSGKCISDIDDVYPSLHKGIRKLVGPFTITDDGYASKWLKEWRRARSQRRQLTGTLETQQGDKVKSKSEVIIADRLDSAGVPYVYEVTMGLDDGDSIRYPDFLVLNKRTRKQYIWEHLGMMDNGSYCVESQIKLEEYARNGYFPGKNLLITYESQNRPLSTRYVDQLIKEFLL